LLQLLSEVKNKPGLQEHISVPILAPGESGKFMVLAID
jgi:hypothetical protein